MAPLSLKRPMSGKPQLEWTVCEHESEWVTARQSVGPAHQPPVRAVWRQRWWTVLTAALLLVGTAGTYLLVQADQEMAQVEAELATTVAAESWTRRHAPEAVAAWVDPAADPVWQNAVSAAPATRAAPSEAPLLAPEAQVRKAEVHGQWALVEVEVAQPEEAWLPSPYRQTRIYRETANGWRRTAPAAFLWQPVMTQQAGRFTFVYGRRDAAAVMGAAPQIVEIDRILRRDLGLPETQQPLTVQVEATLPPTLDPATLYALADAEEMRVPSPALLGLPPTMPEAEALRQLVSEVLVPQAVFEATGGARMQSRWLSLRQGLILWLQAEHSELPSPRRFRLAQSQVGQWAPPDLWSTHVLYGNDCCSDYVSRVFHADAIDGTATLLVEHVESTYGREYLAALAAGMHRHASWHELAPAVFGVPADEFEAGWHQYLATKSGLEVDRSDEEVAHGASDR